MDKLEKLILKLNNKYYFEFLSCHKKKFSHESKIIFTELTRILNVYLKLNLTIKNWELILGPWFYPSINLYYFYSFICKKKSTDNNVKNYIRIIKNKRNVKIFCNDLEDFAFESNSREYLININRFILDDTNIDKFYKKISLNINSYLKYFYLKFIYYFCKKKLLISRPRLNKLEILSLIFITKFKIFALPTFDGIFRKKFKIVKSNREIDLLNLIKKNHNHYRELRFLINFLPSAYLENFYTYLNAGKNLLSNMNVIHSDSTYIADEIFKFQLVFTKNNLQLSQHGGNFRVYGNNLLNVHEKNICSKYFVWGKKIDKKEIQKPSIRISNFYSLYRGKIKNSKKINKYKFCYICPPLKKTNFNFLFNYIENNLEKKIYLKNFFSKIRNKKFVVKGYEENKRYKDQICTNELSNFLGIKNHQIKYNKEVIFRSDFLVFDYFSTLLFEVLSLDLPFILIIDQQKHDLTKYGKDFLKLLKKLGILFNSYNKAQSFINSDKSKNLKNLWQNRRNKAIKKKIIQDFALYDNEKLNCYIKI